MKRTILAVVICSAALMGSAHAGAQPPDHHAMNAMNDGRQRVEMPPALRAHMLANMRLHLVALGEIQTALAAGHFDQAADIAENQVGLSSLEAHGASHLAPYMPKNMRELGMAMHRSASRFARVAQEAAVTNDLPRAVTALGELTQKCTACHATYRVR